MPPYLALVIVMAVVISIGIALYFAGRAGYRMVRRAIEWRQRSRMIAGRYVRPATVPASPMVPLVVAIAQLTVIAFLYAGSDKQRGIASKAFLLISAPALLLGLTGHGLPGL